MKIIFVFYLILLFFLCIALFSIFFTNKERFKSDYSDYTTIDRVKTSGSDEYAYCIAGNVMCPSGKLTNLEDSTYKGGITYSSYCDVNNQTYAECSGNFQHNMKAGNRTWKTPSSKEIQFDYSDIYIGFTTPYSYIPVEISGNYIEFLDSNGKELDAINKCNMLLTDRETYNCVNEIFKEKVTDTKTSDTETSSSDSTKCIAHYGSIAGDDLCCGQKGVLQRNDTKYVCPSDTPTCSGYTCGNDYGVCK